MKQELSSFQLLPVTAFGALIFGLFIGSGEHAGAGETLDALWRNQTVEDGGAINALTQGNTERGLAYNSVTDKVLFVSRSSGLEVVALDGADGSFSHSLDLTDVFGGIFDLNMIGVADDGAVYACNLVLGSSSTGFKVYRWADDSPGTVPTLAFEGDPAGVDEFNISLDPQRWGDSMDVRGSGADTQIVFGSRSSARMSVLTGDGVTFETTSFSGAGNATGSLGVAFGNGDSLYSKDSNQPLRYSTFDLGAGTSELVASFGVLPAGSRPIGVDSSGTRLAALTTTGATLSVSLYDVSEPTLAPILSDSVDFDTTNGNTNATGAVDFGDDSLFALITNNGVTAFGIDDDAQVDPPVVETQPVGLEVIEGGGVTFSVVISGTPPFTFQWQKDAVDIADATSSTLEFLEVAASDAGSYTLVVTNSAGTVTSDAAILTAIPRVDDPVGESKWEVGTEDRPYLATDNAQRGMAVNPVNGNVLVVSRTGGAKVLVLDGATGEDLHQLDTIGVGDDGAIFPLSMIGVAEDGAIYASNLSLNGSQYRIFRWADDQSTTVPTVAFDAAFSGSPLGSERVGDTIAVRGSGTGTQIIAASRLTAEIALFTTTDGENFEAAPLAVAGAEGNFGLGLSFGRGNSIWGNTQGGSLVRILFDPVAETASVDRAFTTADFPASIGPISVGTRYDLLAGISNANPDHIQIFDISDLSIPPVLIDQEFLPSDNGNSNGTGSLAFGDGTLVGLGTNNGLTCLTIDAEVIDDGGLILSDVEVIEGNQIRFTVNGELGKSYTIQDSLDLTEELWDDLQTITLASSTSETFTITIGIGKRFFRVQEVE